MKMQQNALDEIETNKTQKRGKNMNGHRMKLLKVMNSNGRTARMFLVNTNEGAAVELLASFDVRIPNVGS